MVGTIDLAWEDGANSRAKKKAQEAAERERRRLEQQALKKAAEAQDALETENLERKGKTKKGGGNRSKGKKKKNDLSMLDAYLNDEAKSKAKKRGTKQPDLLFENLNRKKAQEEAEGVFSGTGLDSALAAVELTASGQDKVDEHPERRMKARFKDFEARNLPTLKDDYPGLKLSQLKDKLWKGAFCHKF